MKANSTINVSDLKKSMDRFVAEGFAKKDGEKYTINLTDAGIVVVNISQCIAGFVEMGRYDTGYHLQNVGVVSGYDSTVEASVTKLMYLLGKYNDYHVVRTLMARCLAGEFTIPNQNGKH